MIGKFSKRVLLTGAGWSHNWGGQLASDVWSCLIGHPAVTKNDPLRQLLLREPSFEAALGLTSSAPFAPQDRRLLEDALIDIFVATDNEIGRPDHDPWINIYKVQELLFRFWGSRDEGNTAGYLFTLNQDLFLERYLFNEHMAGAPRGALPGLVPGPGQNWFGPNVARYTPAFLMRPMADPASQGRLAGQMNVIKLHGSFNWRSGDGQNLLVMGTDKTMKIAAASLLSWYAKIFVQVLAAGDVRLMIVGYGFGDETPPARRGTVVRAIEDDRGILHEAINSVTGISQVDDVPSSPGNRIIERNKQLAPVQLEGRSYASAVEPISVVALVRIKPPRHSQAPPWKQGAEDRKLHVVADVADIPVLHRRSTRPWSGRRTSASGQRGSGGGLQMISRDGAGEFLAC